MDLEEVLAADRLLLFKHSKACGVSVEAFYTCQAFLAAHPDVPSAWLEVRAQRPLSDRVAQHTGVRHESPQALWIQHGAVTWHASHGAITQQALARATGSGATASGATASRPPRAPRR